MFFLHNYVLHSSDQQYSTYSSQRIALILEISRDPSWSWMDPSSQSWSHINLWWCAIVATQVHRLRLLCCPPASLGDHSSAACFVLQAYSQGKARELFPALPWISRCGCAFLGLFLLLYEAAEGQIEHIVLWLCAAVVPSSDIRTYIAAKSEVEYGSASFSRADFALTPDVLSHWEL